MWDSDETFSFFSQPPTTHDDEEFVLPVAPPPPDTLAGVVSANVLPPLMLPCVEFEACAAEFVPWRLCSRLAASVSVIYHDLPHFGDAMRECVSTCCAALELMNEACVHAHTHTSPINRLVVEARRKQAARLFNIMAAPFYALSALPDTVLDAAIPTIRLETVSNARYGFRVPHDLPMEECAFLRDSANHADVLRGGVLEAGGLLRHHAASRYNVTALLESGSSRALRDTALPTAWISRQSLLDGVRGRIDVFSPAARGVLSFIFVHRQSNTFERQTYAEAVGALKKFSRQRERSPFVRKRPLWCVEHYGLARLALFLLADTHRADVNKRAVFLMLCVTLRRDVRGVDFDSCSLVDCLVDDRSLKRQRVTKTKVLEQSVIKF